MTRVPQSARPTLGGYSPASAPSTRSPLTLPQLSRSFLASSSFSCSHRSDRDVRCRYLRRRAGASGFDCGACREVTVHVPRQVGRKVFVCALKDAALLQFPEEFGSAESLVVYAGDELTMPLPSYAEVSPSTVYTIETTGSCFDAAGASKLLPEFSNSGSSSSDQAASGHSRCDSDSDSGSGGSLYSKPFLGSSFCRHSNSLIDLLPVSRLPFRPRPPQNAPRRSSAATHSDAAADGDGDRRLDGSGSGGSGSDGGDFTLGSMLPGAAGPATTGRLRHRRPAVSPAAPASARERHLSHSDAVPSLCVSGAWASAADERRSGHSCPATPATPASLEHRRRIEADIPSAADATDPELLRCFASALGDSAALGHVQADYEWRLPYTTTAHSKAVLHVTFVPVARSPGPQRMPNPSLAPKAPTDDVAHSALLRVVRDFDGVVTVDTLRRIRRRVGPSSDPTHPNPNP